MARQTSKSVTSSAGRVLADQSSTRAKLSAAAGALTQHRATNEITSARAASRASALLRNPSSSQAERSAAASTLSQRADK